MKRRRKKSATKTHRRKPAKRQRTLASRHRSGRQSQAHQQLRRELDEAREQQTATADVLKVMSRSAFNLQTVLDTLVESAVRLCEADSGILRTREGDIYPVVATCHLTEQQRDRFNRYSTKPDRGSLFGRAILEGRTIHVSDVLADPEYDHSRRRDLVTVRAGLAVPMTREGTVVGVVTLQRKEPRPFSDSQVQLVTTFADQAVIAIENVRLFDEVQARTRELSESLEQQTATSEVLKVISHSPGELEPVFNAMLANATRICEATFGNLFLREGPNFRAVAIHGEERYADQWRRDPLVELHKHPLVPLARVTSTKQVLHIPDMRTDQSYIGKDSRIVPLVELAGGRTFVMVPMLKDDEIVGSIAMYRQEVRPFTDKQIELVRNFAAQAVIAIENTRLLNELRNRTNDLSEALEQQTATSEVLKVISSSRGDLESVFYAMLTNATRICEATFGHLFLCEGPVFRAVAVHSEKSHIDLRRNPAIDLRENAGAPVDRLAKTKQVVHIPDLRADSSYIERNDRIVALVEVGGARTLAIVPMLKGRELIGAIAMYRQKVRPFTDKQIELVQNFAAQAVIAIENTRLLNELRESLQQQTATADVLKVISSSPGDLEPVFQAMLEKATQLCEAKFGVMFRFADGVFRATSWLGNPPAHIIEQPHVVNENPHNLLTRIVSTKQPAHSSDLTKERAYVEGNPRYVALVESVGARSLLVVPMVKNEELIGAIAIYWQEARSFTEKQMELISNFAAQAVIAIDNARLLSELRESLQQQTATADVLKIISRSTFDLQAVLDTLVKSAASLCEADQSFLYRRDGEKYVWAASHGYSPEFVKLRTSQPLVPHRGTGVGRALVESKIVHIPDVLEDKDYTGWDLQQVAGYRAILGVPLLREGVSMGVFSLSRKEPRSFTDKQIELLTMFADQAAIAMENVRLFESVETRTRELAKSLEELRTTQDRLVQTQKLASLGQLTAGIAHEIKNPLNFVNNFSGLSAELIDELGDALADLTMSESKHAEVTELMDTLRGNFDKVVQHGKRADSIVKNMLLHSREGSGKHRVIEINAIVEESLNLAYHGARAEKQGFNITLERSFDPMAGEADLFPQDITRALLNFISNGFYAATKRHAEAKDGYEPTLAAATKNLGDRVEITIRDNGTGMPPDVKEKMFNPFFTTKPAGEGTGLGLSISHDIIVKQHGGSIEVDTQAGEFTEIKVVLPRVAALLPERS